MRNLWNNTKYFRKATEDLGFDTGQSESPIIPIIVGESSLARRFSERLFEEGVFVLPIVYPVVARGMARIRTQMNAQLTKEDLDFAITALKTIGKELAII